MLAILATLTTLTPYSLTARAERAIDPCARANLRRAARLAAQCIGSTFAELCLNDPVLQLCIKRSCRAAGPMPARPWCDVLASGWREGEQHDGHSGKHEASGWRRTAGRRVHVRRVAARVLGREVLLVTLSSRSTRRDKGQNPRNCRRTRLCAPHSSPFDRDISARLGISSPRPRSQCACLVRYSCLLPPLLSCAASVEDIIYTCKRNVQWLLVGLCHERSSNHEP